MVPHASVVAPAAALKPSATSGDCQKFTNGCHMPPDLRERGAAVEQS